MADPRDGHADHDPGLVASMLDRDPNPVERSAAEALIASCGSCAALHADLLALSAATVELPIPTRPRDFRVTAADAARLTAPVAAEPGTEAPRLAGVMTDPRTAASHASHDTMLVASLVDHSLEAPEREAAEALVAACGLCADLHADLVALRAATRAMPTPARPRDYTLTHDDAYRLRPAGWRRLVAAFGTSRDAFSRPLAIGLTTLGLAGLLVANIPSLSFGSAASAPTVLETGGNPVTVASPAGVTDTAGQGAAAAAASAPAAAAASPAAAPDSLPVKGAAELSPLPAASNGFGSILRDGASPTSGTDLTNGSTKGLGGAPGRSKDLTGSPAVTPAQDSTGVSTLVLLSGVFLIAGLCLFGIRWAARRIGED